MATVKTYDDVGVIQTAIYEAECKHNDDEHDDRMEGNWCYAAVCLKCGEITFECQTGWKDDCVCDAEERNG